MRRIRVLLCGRTRLFREIVANAIRRASDMEVVGEVRSPNDLLLRTRDSQPDAIVITASAPGDPDLSTKLLAACPRLTILALSESKDAGFVEQLCPQRRRIAELSQAGILRALRQAVLHPCDYGQTAKEERL